MTRRALPGASTHTLCPWALLQPRPRPSDTAQAALCVPACSSITAMLVAGWEPCWSRPRPTDWLAAWPGSCLVTVDLRSNQWTVSGADYAHWTCSWLPSLTVDLPCHYGLVGGSGLSVEPGYHPCTRPACLTWVPWDRELLCWPCYCYLLLAPHSLWGSWPLSFPDRQLLSHNRLRKASHRQPYQHKISPAHLSKKNWLW